MDFLLRQPPSGTIITADDDGDVIIWDATSGVWATGRLTSDQITNLSSVPGTTVSDALDNLAGGGGDLTNLPNTVWVAAGTTVDPGDQTGNIEAPFSTLAAGIAALAALASNAEKVLVVMPGDYDGEAAVSWDASQPDRGRLTILNGSGLVMQMAQSIGNVLFPACAFANGIIIANGITFNGNITGAAHLYLSNCQKTSGTIAADRIDASDSYLSAAMTLASANSQFNRCSLFDITTPGDTPQCLVVLGCNCAGDIIFTGDPGIVLMDDYSIFTMQFNISQFTNGAPRLAHPVMQAWFGTAGGQAAGTFLGAFSETFQATEARAQYQFAYPTTLTGAVVTTARSGGAAADMDFNIRRNGVEVGTIRLPSGANSAKATDMWLAFEIGQLLSVENEDGTAAGDDVRVMLIG